MDDIDLEKIPLLFGLLVPGMIALYFRSQCLTGRTSSSENRILSYAVLTAVYYGITYPFAIYVINFQGNLWVTYILWLLLMVIIPSMFGIFIGWITQKGFIREKLSLWGLVTVSSIPTAWDWKFSRMPGEWVIVTLKNGITFAGFCGVNSFISSDPSERDMFIQAVYEIQDKGAWVPTNRSLLIMPGEVSTVEFLSVTEGVINEQKPADK